MLDKIDSNDVTVQVEGSKLNRVVPDGIAISKGLHDLGLGDGGSTSFTNMSMYKNGDQTIGTGWTAVTGWTANASYSGTVITSNALVMATAGQARIALKGRFGSGLLDSRLVTYMRVKVNGTVIKETSGNKYASLSVVIPVSVGDSISVESKITNWWSGGNKIRSGTETSLTVKLNTRGRVDFEDDLLWPDKTEFISTSGVKYVVPPGKMKGRKSIWRMFSEAHDSGFGDNVNISSSYRQWSGFSVGPVLTQTKVPVPVEAGMTVGMSGTFHVRGIISSGDGAVRNDLDQNTRAIIRFSLWGKGVVQDEYGVDVLTTTELMYYEGLLGSSQGSFTGFNIGGVPAATVPAGITDVFFTISAIYETGGEYGSIDYEFEEVNKVLRVTYLGCAEDTNPLVITANLPSSINKTYTHSISKTGVAFKNRARFDNIQPSANMVFFGYPGIGCVIDIYNWNGSRGTLIGTYTATANQRREIAISPATGVTGIEIVKNGASNDFFIESVSNNAGHNLSGYWNQIELVNFANVNDDISKVSIVREEGDKSTATIDFCSDILDPATSATLKPGKVVRVLGRHYGAGITKKPSDWVGEANYEVIYQGIIKRVTSKYSYDDQPIIQVTAYDAVDPVERLTTGVILDEFSEYGAYFNRVGVPVIYNDIDWGGDVKAMPNKFKFRPSAYGNMSLADSLSTTRNTYKAYWYVDRYNRVIIKNSLSSTSVITLTDGTLEGDISYGNIAKGSDTDSVINKITVNESLLDRKDYIEKQLPGGDTPPLEIDYILSKTQTATFSNVDSINSYGEFEKSFDVVRGTGDPLELFYGKLGTSFSEWAQDILDERSEPTMNVSDMTVPIKSSDQIRKISSLEILDRVTIAYKSESQFTRIREIEHTIMPGKWFVEIRFNSKGDMTYWG